MAEQCPFVREGALPVGWVATGLRPAAPAPDASSATSAVSGGWSCGSDLCSDPSHRPLGGSARRRSEPRRTSAATAMHGAIWGEVDPW